MTLDHLTDRASREYRLRKKADAALAAGILTKEEHDYYLEKELGLAKEEPTTLSYLQPTEKEKIARKRQRTARKAGATIALLAILLTTLWFFAPQPSGLSGFVTYSPTTTTLEIGETIRGDASLPLNATSLSGLRASGTLVNGSGSIWLVAPGGRLLVWSGTAIPQQTLWTPFESYALNESVNVTVVPEGASFTLWLTDASGGKTLVEPGFIVEAPGAYVLDALINDSGNITKLSADLVVRNDTNTSNDRPRSPLAPRTEFNEACQETCSINVSGNLSLFVETDGELTISQLSLITEEENSAPASTANVPDLTLTLGESTTLNLSNYFSDAENDTLTYDYMNTGNALFNIDSNQLTITATSPGVEQSILYASDSHNLAQSNIFTITVYGATNNSTNNSTNSTNNNSTSTNQPPTTNNNTNSTTTNTTNNNTSNTTNNITNTTLNGLPTAGTNNTINQTLNCTNPDPNKRPLGCLQQAANIYFKPQSIPLENLDRTVIGRLTPIGNLLIKGDVIEKTTETPGNRDFVVTRIGEYGEQTPVAWIDTTTGNLHLKGTLHEENLNMAPPRDSYVIQNSQSITIAYIDRESGDLYLMGDLIPYRRSLEVKR